MCLEASLTLQIRIEVSQNKEPAETAACQKAGK
jgi:hypothetical protein